MGRKSSTQLPRSGAGAGVQWFTNSRLTGHAVFPGMKCYEADMATLSEPWGRDVELGRLHALAEAARQGRGRAVWLVGEAGTGKSRLKAALAEALAGSEFEVWEVSGAALPGTPVGPFLELLAPPGKQAPDGVRQLSSAEAEVVAAFLAGHERQGIPASVEADRSFLFDALSKWLVPRGGRPRLLVLEDWQEADRVSHRLVEHVVARLPHASTLLLVLQRPGGPGPVPAGAEVLTLAPLSSAQSAPEALTPERRAVLQAVALLGPGFPRAALTAVLGTEAPPAWLEAEGWLRPVAGERFLRGGAFPGEEAQGLHLQAARAYETLPPQELRRFCAQAARHWLGAGDLERALPHLVRVAEWHAAACDPLGALAVYRTTLDRTVDLSPVAAARWWPVLWERIGDMHRFCGDRAEAEQAFRMACELLTATQAPAEWARCLHKLAAAVLALGRYHEAVALCDEGLQVSGPGALLQASALDALAALALCYLGRFDAAQERTRAARVRLRQVPQQEGPARAGVEAALHRAAGNALMGLGQPSRAAAEYEAGMRRSESIGDTWEHSIALFNLGDAHARAGDRERAVHFFQLALDLQARIGDRFGRAYTHHGLAQLHTRAGAPEFALEDARRGLVLAAELGDRKLKSLLHCALGRAHHRLGERGEAARQLQLAAQEAAAVGARPELLQAEAAFKEFHERR